MPLQCLLCRFDFGSFYPSQGDASHCFIGEGAGQGYNINVPWEHGKCGDADYVAVWDHILLPIAEAFDPDIILVSAGFDAGKQVGKFLELVPTIQTSN
jgi:histone deacetylase 6